MLRKKIINARNLHQLGHDWKNIADIAQVEITSEDPACPIESALSFGDSSGWKAAQTGAQTVRILFDNPQRIKHIQLQFDEKIQSRTQEFVLCWSTDGGKSYREIVRQQYTFSPPGTVCEIEDYTVDIQGVTVLELRIVPDINKGNFLATLTKIQVA